MMNLALKISNAKLVIFDLDGTLYDKRHLSFRMVCHALGDIRKMQAERKTRAGMKGMWLEDEQTFYHTYFQQLAKQLHSAPDMAKQWYEKRYMPLMVKTIGKYQHVSKWVLPFIHDCQQKGIKMVVLSDYGHATEKLEALGLSPTLFDWVVSAPELGGLKPAPQLMQIVTKQMGVTAEECLVIGDREDTDGEMARKAGAEFVQV
ncbi:MAG: HAD family hydrolase [Paludibacteraceae bacterium]|nr:HAD family hydrolase [Paludibacteraceae bacterium]